MDIIGEQFARAVAAKDTDALTALLDPAVDFRGLTPGRSWEARDAEGVIAIFVESWFEPADRIEGLVDVRAGDDVADTQHVSYRLDVTNDAGPHVVEQQAYYRVRDGRIAHLRVLCSGFRPVG